MILPVLWNAANAQARTSDPLSRTAAIQLPGYNAPAFGRWLDAKSNGSGLPLGGLGTGFLELRPDGTVRDSCLWNNWLKPRPPRLLRFTATFGRNSKAKSIVLISTAGASGLPAPARYFGHYPMVDMDFGRLAGVSASAWLRASAPFVPGDADLSNIPAALFTLRIRNTGAALLPVRVEIAFADAPDDRTDAPNSNPGPSAQFRTATGAGIEGSTGKGSGFAIAAAGEGWGTVAASPGHSDRQTGVTRISAEISLKTGEERKVAFVLAWYAPTWTTSDGKAARNRYASRFADARGVATYALERAGAIEQKIIAWQEQTYARPLPAWLKDALVNSLYALARNSIWLDDGRLLVNESFTGRPVTESVACRFNGSFPLLALFPEQEKQTMRSIAKLQAQNGEIPFGLGAPIGIETGMFGAQRPILSTEFVLLCYRDYVQTQDMEFLVGLYPRIKRALQYAMTLDTDGDGLINEAPGSDTGFPSNQFYDNWPWFGTSAYTAGIGLAALRAGEEAARSCGDEEFAQWCRGRFDKGRIAYEELLWTGRFYRLYSDPDNFRQSDTCLANQLCGQMYSWLCDLGDLLPLEHLQDALRSIDRLNLRGTIHGAISGVKPDGTPDESGGEQSRDVVVAETWNLITTVLTVAARRDNAGLQKQALAAAERLHDSLSEGGRIWDQPFVLSAKEGIPVRGHHFTGSLSLWAVSFGLEGKSMRRQSRAYGLSFQPATGK